MKKRLLLIMSFFLVMGVSAQDKKAYKLFDAKGNEVTYAQMIKTLCANDVVFIGEVHNCPIAHWMEYEIIKSLHQKHGDKLAIGAEMFETDNQIIVDEYVSKMISSDRFEAEARLWDNYYTDYSSIIGYARENGLKFVATNTPRRYANMVSAGGLEALDKISDEAKKFLAPLPIKYVAEDSDQDMYALMMMTGKKKGDPENLAKAQALKDATMGWFISKNIKSKFVHFNGNYHSDFKKGIIPYLNIYRPGLKIATVCSVRQDEIDKLGEENEGRADFFICVPIDMTTTY